VKLIIPLEIPFFRRKIVPGTVITNKIENWEVNTYTFSFDHKVFDDSHTQDPIYTILWYFMSRSTKIMCIESMQGRATYLHSLYKKRYYTSHSEY